MKDALNSVIVDIRQRLHAAGDISPDRQAYFFKTKPGEYAEHDRFLGVRVPAVRLLAKEYAGLSITEVEQLLASPFNEERLLALFILMRQYKKAGGEMKQFLYEFYCHNLCYVNNWNLVDASARDVMGVHLLTASDRSILERLAQSSSVWERRVAIVATWAFIRKGDFTWTLRLAEKLLSDEHDLMHKAAGWMLREVGERDGAALRSFLGQHAVHMPRTMLRYAIEKFSAEERQRYMQR